MSGMLYLFMAVASLVLWKSLNCAVCVNNLDIGFLGKSWYLWGAMFYAFAALLAFRFKKRWPVAAVMAAGLIFHGSLIINIYIATKVLCPYCVGFALGEVVALVVYRFEHSKLRDHFLAWGPARLALFVSTAFFFFSPTVNHSIPDNSNAYAMGYTDKTLTNQVVSNTNYASSNAPDVQHVQKSGNSNDSSSTIPSGDSSLSVIGQDGGQLTLSIKNRPILFFAWWCPHCDDALKNIAKLPPWKRPYLVAVFNQGNNSDANIKQKLKANGLMNTPYYIYGDIPPVQGVPSLFMYSDGLQKSYDTSLKNLDEVMSKFVSEPKWGYNIVAGKYTPVSTPGAIKYTPITNQQGVLRWLTQKGSILADIQYLEAIDAAGKKYDVNPLLLLAITGQEQSFVPRSWPGAEQMAKNPFNVYGSWQVYAPGFRESAEIAAKTVNSLSADCPAWMNPIQWIDYPENPNCRYAEDTNWWVGVQKYFNELNNL